MSEEIHNLQNSYATLQASYSELQSSYDTLDENFRTTLNNYNQLDADYNMLQSNFDSLQTDFHSLSTEYDALESDYQSLESEHNKLKIEISSLQFENNQLEIKNRNLQALLDEYENVPHSYYSSEEFSYHSNMFDELCHFLTFEFALPRSYEEDIFDCSESSALLEWALENAGFDAEITVGPTPWDPNSGYHAWVIVYTTDYRVAIEATALTGEYNWVYLFAGRTPGIVYGDDSLIPGWENYYEGYDESFRNIYMAIRDFGTGLEWNWWEGAFGFE
jgi:prefoldin subunit 5